MENQNQFKENNIKLNSIFVFQNNIPAIINEKIEIKISKLINLVTLFFTNFGYKKK